MSDTTKLTQEDILHTQSNAETNNKQNYPLIEHKEVPNTPFYTTGSQDKGYFLRMGDYRITEIHKTKQEAEDQLRTSKWLIIIRIIGAIIERYLNDKKQ